MLLGTKEIVSEFSFIFLQHFMSKKVAEHQSINNALMAFPGITV